MIKIKKACPRALSMVLSVMLVISAVIPSATSRSQAEEPVVTHTATQQIVSFAVRLNSGAANKGTEDEPDYVWKADKPDAGHEFKYQLDYVLSGEGELSPGSVRFTLPLHILRDRDGEYADLFEIALPSREDVPSGDTENEFVYKTENGRAVIYNRLAISAAQTGSVQFSYKTEKQTFDYRDMTVSDSVTAELSIDKGEDEHLYNTAQGPPVAIDTGASLSSASKSLYYAYDTWQDYWGSPASFGIEDTEDYLYLVWRIEYDVTATQPYTLSFKDTVAGEYGDTSVVGIQMNGKDTYSDEWQSGVLSSTGEHAYSFVLTKHLKETYEPYITYRVNNRIRIRLHPNDEQDADVNRVSSAVYTYSQPKPDYP